MRQTTIDVLDFRDTWQYYDARKYLNGKLGIDGKPIRSSELLQREIYSDPRGTILLNSLKNGGVHTGTFDISTSVSASATALPNTIFLMSDYRINDISVNYPEGGGPSGVTQTGGRGGDGWKPRVG
ncbi:hypothetical protein [Pedobacter aquatilis]|uniref:hypothetical protein n=1 Tax=Pedobacter aquatilis TaxID=351343 RepID=UPI00292CC98C|nr:hypothetical protein [Pedobacter aquatilis]